jgi:hypothetical protein
VGFKEHKNYFIFIKLADLVRFLLYGKLALSSIYTGDNIVDIAAITGSGNLKR